MEWRPATIEAVCQIVQENLLSCDPNQIAAFEKYRVSPRYAPILRLRNLEHVVVIAKKENQVIYWNDIEEGFGVSPIDAEGRITDEDSSQNDLGLALNAWI